MPVVSSSLKMNTQRKGGRVDLQKLLEHTPMHPKGRVQIDPATGLIRSPKNNVLYKKNLKVKVEGHVVGEKEIPVNGGHVRYQDRVWRIPLNGPSRYHWKVIKDDERYRFGGKGDRTAPVLTDEEMREYQFFRSFISETKTVLKEGEFDKTDDKFYSWLEKQDQDKIKLIPLSTPVENQ